jgi:predicted transposase/invertase (TIGR01784 family)
MSRHAVEGRRNMSSEPRDPDDKTGNLHNNFFHASFSQPEAIGRLMAELAPRHVFALLTPGSPALVHGSVVDEKLRGRQTDLLFKARLKTGGDAYVYILVEHKSSPNPEILLQLLRYMCAIWSRMGEGAGSLTSGIPSF